MGTASDPKFELKVLWKEVFLPSYDALVAVGGPAEGATVIHQEDNASPHQEGILVHIHVLLSLPKW